MDDDDDDVGLVVLLVVFRRAFVIVAISGVGMGIERNLESLSLPREEVMRDNE